MHRILAINADAVAAYLNAQIDAGAQAVMVFDSWGGVLEHRAFRHFSLAYTRRVLAQLTRESGGHRVPCIVFTKGGGPWLEEIATIGADVVGLDWTCDLGRPAGQPRPDGALRLAGGYRRRGAGGARQLRQPGPSGRTLWRPRLQSRPRHQPAHATRSRAGPGRNGACPFTADSASGLTLIFLSLFFE
jgi:hypothetical protein